MTTEQKLKHNKWRKERRRITNNSSTKKYEKTINGFLMRTYRNMKSRVSGVQYKKAHLYYGKFLLSKEIFYEWAKSNKQFKILFNKWVLSNYNRKLTPSIDRIDSSKGYSLNNMRWLTHSMNSKLGNRHVKNI